MHPQVSIPELMIKVRGLASRLKRRVPAHVDREDLEAAGLLGLSRALAQGYVGDPGVFQTYALRCAAGAMLDELRGNDPLSRGERNLARRLSKAEHDLGQLLGREPESHEVAEALGMSPAELAEARRTTARRDRVSLSAAGPDGPAQQSTRPDALLDAVEQAETLRKAKETLPERLKLVLELSCEDDLTLREIGEHLGVTEGRVCQLRQEAVRKLRAHCEAA